MGVLANLRKGIIKHKIDFIPGSNVKVALVKLNNKVVIETREKAMEYMKGKVIDKDTSEIIFNVCLLEEAIRDKDNLQEKITTYEEINENLSTEEIYELYYKYLEVQNGSTDNIEKMTEEEFEEIKKNLDQIQVKDLDGELQTILRLFHQTLILRT